jgi:hypothetical protein
VVYNSRGVFREGDCRKVQLKVGPAITMGEGTRATQGKRHAVALWPRYSLDTLVNHNSEAMRAVELMMGNV